MVWHPRNKWRSVIKHVTIIHRSLLNRFLKYLILLPPLNERSLILRSASSAPCLIFHTLYYSTNRPYPAITSISYPLIFCTEEAHLRLFLHITRRLVRMELVRNSRRRNASPRRARLRETEITHYNKPSTASPNNSPHQTSAASSLATSPRLHPCYPVPSSSDILLHHMPDKSPHPHAFADPDSQFLSPSAVQIPASILSRYANNPHLRAKHKLLSLFRPPFT